MGAIESIEKNLNQGVETKYIPEANVGDIFYWTGDFTADFYIGKCEIRKIEESKTQPGKFLYFIRYKLGGEKHSKQNGFCIWPDDYCINHIYHTPEDAMNVLVKRFKEKVMRGAAEFNQLAKRINYTLPDKQSILQLPKSNATDTI